MWDEKRRRHWVRCKERKVLSVQICSNCWKCSLVCMCFDSLDIFCNVTVSLLANYHGNVMGQVKAGSHKLIGDSTYAEEAAI